MKPDSTPAKLALTVGDPCGIGPEITLRALAQLPDSLTSRLVICGPAGHLRNMASHLRIALPPLKTDCLDPDRLSLFDTGPDTSFEPGVICAAGGTAAIQAIEKAHELCFTGKCRAMITGPIGKGAIRAAGSPYSGHTDMLGALCGVPDTKMAMIYRTFRVVLATLHIPYHQVLRDLTVESLYHTLLLTQAFFATPRRPQPRIAVAGLNPHAGEDGLFGDEETTIIKPAIERLKGVNPHIFGPFPADSLFKAELRRSYDVFVAQTHDQGLIAIKTLFGIKCVNVTLGLPYIRTSVGHGTAYDIAADCKADPNGMIEAIREADRLVKARPPAAPVHPSQRRR